MKAMLNRESLAHSFNAAAAVVPTRGTKDVLKYVKLQIDGQDATLMATDMELGVRIELDGVQCEVPGAVLLPVARFGSLLRESTDDQLTIESTESGVAVRGERFEVVFLSIDAAEFPEVPRFERTAYHEVSAKILRDLLHRTAFAADQENARYALGGVLIQMEGECITAVGTDGRRLAKMQGEAQPFGDHSTEGQSPVVPIRTVTILERATSDLDGDVQIAVDENEVLIRAGRMVFFSRLISGRFPNWETVMPKRRAEGRITLPVAPAYSALRQAAIVATKDSRGIDFEFHEGSLRLTANAADAGESRVELPVTYNGPKLSLRLDHQYVSDFLRVLEPERTFALEAENAEQPVLFSVDDGYDYVVMPLARPQGQS